MDKERRGITDRTQFAAFLDAVMDGHLASGSRCEVLIDEILDVGPAMHAAFIKIGNLKIKVISHRDDLEYRFGSLKAPNMIEDKADGERVWFFVESVRDFLRGRLPVCEDEIFKKTPPVGPSRSFADLCQLVLSLEDGLQNLFDTRNFVGKRAELDNYEKERSAQISAISRRRYPHTRQ